jgi:hypothetical protein
MTKFTSGTCPRCGTQNRVFRGVEAPTLPGLDELAQEDPERSDSRPYVVYWECWHCRSEFETEATL